MERVAEDAVRIDARFIHFLYAEADRSCRMLRIRGLVLRHRLLQPVRERLRRCFVLPVRNELLYRRRML